MALKNVFACTAMLCFIGTSVLAQSVDPQKGNGSHSISWEKLRRLDKKFLQDKQTAPVLTPPLKTLLGEKYPGFMRSIQVNFPIEIKNGVLIATGMKPHSGGNVAAAVFYGMKGELLAVRWSGGKLEYYGRKQLLTNPAVAAAVKEMAR